MIQNAKMRNLGHTKRAIIGWFVIVIFFGGVFWFCRNRFHMVYPEIFILSGLAVSILFVLAMWWLYRFRPRRV